MKVRNTKGSLTYVLSVIMLLVSVVTLAGCAGEAGDLTDMLDSAGSQPTTDATDNTSDDKEAQYEQYIRDALREVSDDATMTDGEEGKVPTVAPEDETGKIVFVDPKNAKKDSESVYVSSAESEATPVPTETVQETPTTTPVTETVNDKNGELTPTPTPKAVDKETTDDNTDPNATPTPTPPATPDEFPVGVCTIYIKGEMDTSYATGIIDRINTIRTEMNYPELIENESLDKCAEMRSREISCYLSHQRPDGSQWNSLAPDYFKAELLAIDGTDEEETVDAWAIYDISKKLLFTTEYTKIGAACFVCNGLNCIVVSFGL